MSLTTKNQLLIAFKKLVGKAHTNAQFGSANESVASNVQLDNSTIFAQPIPSAPNTALYSITNNIVEKVQFSLTSISLSQYTAVGAAGGGITADGDGAPTQGAFTNGIHAYALTLPSNYTTLSSNPKKGTGVFVNSQSLTGSNGGLQIVPERYGASYPAEVSSSSGILAALDEEDYLLDPYSGILFLQDINRVPTSVTAYIYIGDYLNQTVSGSTAQFTTVSASIVSASQYVGLPSFSTTPGGTDQTVQFNSGSTFSGSSQLTYNYNTNILSGTIARFSVVTSSFTGSGAGLFNLTASGISNFTNDVRSQFSAGTNITIVGGVISSTGGGGGTPGGVNTTIQFNSGSTFSGSTNLVFDYVNNILSGTVARFTTITASLIGTASFATNAGNANTVTNGVYTNTNNTFTAVNTFSNFYITGSITGSDAKFTTISGSHTGSGAGLFGIPNTGLVNSSVTVGSTNIALGGTATTLQGITVLTGSTVTGSTALFTQITGNLFGTSSFAANAGNANTVTNGVYTNTNNTFTAVNTFTGFYITGSITGSDAKFTSITGSHAGSGAGLTNIPNAGLVNSSVTIGSTNIVLGGTATTLQGITVLTGSTVTGSIALFSQITGAFSGNGINITNITASNISNFTNDVRNQFSPGTNITIVGGVISSTGGGGGTPGGSNTTIQFNSGSTFSGSTNLVFDYTNNILSGTVATFTVITSSFTGSGAGLFNLTASGINNFTNDVRNQFSAGTNITIVGGVISSTGGGGGGTPGGTDQTVQFNSGSTFSGSTNLVYNYNTNTLSGTVAQFTVITSSFTGSGAGLFNLTASGINNFTNDVRGQFSAGANITIAGGVISATTGSVIGSVITVTGNYIVLTTDDRIFTNGTLTLTLPSAVGSSGKSYYIKNIGTGSVTITGTLGEKIDGYDNMIITEQNSALGLLSNNIGWYIF